MKGLNLRTITKKNKNAATRIQKRSSGKQAKGLLMPEKLAFVKKLIDGVPLPEETRTHPTK
ncbi:MAG: hypothetical protein JWQ09_3604 [Segetibacter sp.]|nr:hypothetical protein [Segetibacter sp.]